MMPNRALTSPMFYGQPPPDIRINRVHINASTIVRGDNNTFPGPIGEARATKAARDIIATVEEKASTHTTKSPTGSITTIRQSKAWHVTIDIGLRIDGSHNMVRAESLEEALLDEEQQAGTGETISAKVEEEAAGLSSKKRKQEVGAERGAKKSKQ